GGDLMIDTLAPERPTIDLIDASDSGRNNQDNITKLTTLTFRVTAEPNSMVVIKDGETVIDTFTMPNAAFTLRTIDFTTLPGGLVAEGQHPLSAEATDKAGNRSAQSDELDVTIDLTPPPAPTIAIDPKENDSGVQGAPG